MKKINISTSFKKLPADIYTPVGIYLRLRDRYRDSILLESTDFHANENSYSIIGINAVAGIEITDNTAIEFKLPLLEPTTVPIDNNCDLPAMLWDFMQSFAIEESVKMPVLIAQGLFGYTTYDAVQFFEKIQLRENPRKENREERIPLMRYRLYQYVIVLNHFKDELFICENHFEGMESDMLSVENIIRSKDVPEFPFYTEHPETSAITDETYLQMVEQGIKSCRRGDVFQVVLGRRFYQPFTGDDFNVYRSLRSINPSPYLFYFDYGSYKLMGSSPESQLMIEKDKALVHPIAGTFKRTGDDDTDKALAIELELDPKENAEHVMLVDLARNDLSRLCTEVTVNSFKKVKYYSHVIHLVSEVQGTIGPEKNPFKILGSTFPAGTLSGAPKYKAMQIINELESGERGFYGGAIGYIGFNGNCNHAIMIRTLLSKNNTLISQAGAGIVVSSIPGNELLEVNNKLGAIKNAISLAKTIFK